MINDDDDDDDDDDDADDMVPLFFRRIKLRKLHSLKLTTKAPKIGMSKLPGRPHFQGRTVTLREGNIM